jgi:hypothetical protein
MKWKARLAAAGVALASIPMASARELDAGDEGASARPGALQARVEYGASTAAGAPQAGFKLVVSGGPPGGAVWLALEPTLVRPALYPFALDGLGEGSLVVRSWGAGACDALIAARSRSGQPAGVARIKIEPPPPEGFQWYQRGEIVVMELMKDPSFVPDSTGEWIEIYNRSANVIDLEGWQLSDAGSSKHTLKNGGAGIFIVPGQRLVLGNSADRNQNGFVTVQYKYSGFSLGNGADEIRLRDPLGVLVDRVAYDDGIFWPDLPGRSISLRPQVLNAYLNDNAANWCHSTSPIGNGNSDTGTPGKVNDSCP